MKRVFTLFLSSALLLALLASCASSPAPSGADTFEAPASTSALAQTTAAPTEPAHVNEKGPFDEEHYQIGLRALQAVDDYLYGKLTSSEVNQALSSCYDEISALPELPESDPLYPGNDFVKAYVFLAKIDFDMQMSDFATKKYDDRNYLASAIGEPEKVFDVSNLNTAQVDAMLDNVFASLEENIQDSRFSHNWTDGNLFINISMSGFDYYYQHKDSLSADDRANVERISHGYVSGEVGSLIYDAVRKTGGDGFDVYITLSGCAIFCSSRNLEIFMDPLNE